MFDSSLLKAFHQPDIRQEDYGRRSTTTSNQKVRKKEHAHYYAMNTDGQQETTFPCEFCPREFSRRSYLNNHRKKVHNAPEVFTERWLDIRKSRRERAIYKCRICPKSYCSSSSLKNHLKKKHESQPINPGQCPPAKCFLCEEKFWTLSSLFKHIRTQHERNVQQAGILTKMSVPGTVSQEQDANKENNVISELLASSSSGTPPSRGSPVNVLPTIPDRKRTPFMISDILN